MKIPTRLTILAAAVSLAVTSGCSRETVPPAYFGKVLSAEGYSPELLTTGKHWLAWWNDLVLLEGSTTVIQMPLTVTMAEYSNNADGVQIQVPGLDMKFIVSLRYSIKPDEEVIQAMFSSITINPEVGVTAHQAFTLYASDIIETLFRDLVGEMTPEEAFANRAKISNDFGQQVNERLKNTPIRIEVALVKKMTLPNVIVQRIATTKDTELQQAQENEKQLVELIKKNNEITLERKESERKLVAASGESAANRELAKGINPQVLELRKLEIQKVYALALKERMSHPPTDGDTIFLPFDSLTSPAAQMKMFNSIPTATK